jgi:hypothetical protein
MLGTFALENRFRFRNAEVGACPPLLTDPSRFVSADRLADCRTALALIKPLIEAYPAIIISASWATYAGRSESFLDAFFDTVRSLSKSGKQVVIIGQAPVIAGFDRLCREKALSIPLVSCQVPKVPLAHDVAVANQRLRAFAADTPNVRFFDVTPYLCDGGLCSAFNDDGKPRYYDPSHLTLAASWELGKEIVRRDGVPAAFSGLAAPAKPSR